MATCKRPEFADLTGRVAIITGGSRGIGRQCALDLAKLGCNIVIAAKTVTPQPTLPGTIYTVADEVEKFGVKSLPFQLDARDAKQCQACVDATIAKFGRVDILINNASALWWRDITDTPVSKYDLITTLNARGSFMMAAACLPHMQKAGWGHVINMSPPISARGMAGHTAYNISKLGMTMVALGVAQENKGKGVAGNSLWPATVVESLASENFEMGDKSMWRKATVLSDVVCHIVSRSPHDCTNNMFYDDDYLREHCGFEDADFVQYQVVQDGPPPPLLLKMGLEESASEAVDKRVFERGRVADLKQTKAAKALSKL